MGIKIDGLVAFDEALQNIVRDMPEIVEDVLNQQAELLMADAKQRTPVDTGLLRNSWKRTNATDGRVEVYNNVNYANHVEWGHRTTKGGLIKGRKMLQTATEIRRREFIKDTKVIIDNLLNG